MGWVGDEVTKVEQTSGTETMRQRSMHFQCRQRKERLSAYLLIASFSLLAPR